MITLVDALYRNGAERPDKVALIFRDQQVTYGQLLEQAALLGGYLQAQGIQPGDRVMLTGASRPEYVIALLAVQLMGGVTVPVDRNPLKTTLAYIAQLTDAKLYLSTNKKVPEGLPYVRYVDALEAANALGQKAAPPQKTPTASQSCFSPPAPPDVPKAPPTPSGASPPICTTPTPASGCAAMIFCCCPCP